MRPTQSTMPGVCTIAYAFNKIYSLLLLSDNTVYYTWYIVQYNAACLGARSP